MEDVEQHLAVSPEVATSSTIYSIGDVQVKDPGVPITEDQERLRQFIWKNKHLLIVKCSALPTAAHGAGCDIDVGGTNPIAHRVEPVALKIRKKLTNVIIGLLSEKIIRPSISPWMSQ